MSDELERARNAGFVEASRIHGAEIERLRGLLRECEPAVYSQHMVAIGTRIAMPTTLLARVRAEIERATVHPAESDA